MSATPDSTLANPEQRIADLERQLAERAAELAEARDQQTATTEVLQVINSSPGDLAPVFDAMLEKATSLCGAAFGLLFTWDSDCFHPVAWRGISRELLAVLREPSRPQPGTLTWRIARGENIVSSADLLEAVSTADLLEAEAYRNGIARVRALVDFGGARSHVGIALRKDDAVLGHLSIYRQEVRPFTDKEIALLQNFAAQAVIAMENARLLSELRKRTDQVAEMNRGLEASVAEQVEELGRVGRLKRFLAPQLAELIVSQGDEKILESHRREIVIVFCDCAATPPSPRRPSPRKCSIFNANTMAHWDPSSPNSRLRSTISLATGSWCSSTTHSPVPTRPSARSKWRWRCARRPAS